ERKGSATENEDHTEDAKRPATEYTEDREDAKRSATEYTEHTEDAKRSATEYTEYTEYEGRHGWRAVRPWALHGLALALLPWLHTRFAVLAATLGGLILVRLARVPDAMAKAIAFLIPPAVSAVAWMFFFVVLYG